LKKCVRIKVAYYYYAFDSPAALMLRDDRDERPRADNLATSLHTAAFSFEITDFPVILLCSAAAAVGCNSYELLYYNILINIIHHNRYAFSVNIDSLILIWAIEFSYLISSSIFRIYLKLLSFWFNHRI